MRGKEALTLVDTLLHSANPGQRLNDVQSVVFLETWAGQSYRQIAQQLGYQHDYIKQVGSQLWKSLSQSVGESVSKRNLQSVLRRYQQKTSSLPASVKVEEKSCIPRQQDWREPIDVSRFYGRQEELETLETWIVSDRSRLIGIFGLGGIGKTALSVKFTQHIQSHFDCIIWRSLQQAPSLELILRDILPILSGSELTTDYSINALIKLLRQKRCLLVFDNIESILQEGDRSGQYQPGYEAYRQLFERISDEHHQSCILLTGREKPSRFALWEEKNLPVRSLHLQGLPAAAAQQILIAKGLDATEPQQLTLVNYFGGNPLALKLAATTIRKLFCGNIQAFLAQGNTIFSDLWDLLEQQFERLSLLQQQIMYWLAINREGVTPKKLQQEILPKVSWRDLLEALESLHERSLIFDERSLVETERENLTLQPAIMEYVTERFIQTLQREITTGNFNLFRTHTLIEFQTQDYRRNTQIQLIFHPLTQRLLTHFTTQAQLEKHLCQILVSLLHQTAEQTDYTERNLLNLFCQMELDLMSCDFSHLVIRQAYDAKTIAHHVDLPKNNSEYSVGVSRCHDNISIRCPSEDNLLLM